MADGTPTLVPNEAALGEPIETGLILPEAIQCEGSNLPPGCTLGI
jgi:hypothetical protein